MMTNNLPGNSGLSAAQQALIVDLFGPVVDLIVDRVREAVLTTNKPLKYYSRQETAQLLRITLPTLARLTKDGILPAKKIGSRILYDASTIDEAVRENRTFKYKRAK